MIAINNESNGCKNGLLNGVMKTINAQSNFTISKMRNLFYGTLNYQGLKRYIETNFSTIGKIYQISVTL